MWGKPAGWKDLSEEDRAWALQTKDAPLQERLLTAISENKPERVTFLVHNKSFTPAERLELALCAIRSNTPDLIPKVLGSWGFYSLDSVQSTQQLFKAALTAPLAVWETLCSTNRNSSHNTLRETTIATIAASADSPPELVRHYMEEARQDNTGLFQIFVEQAVTQSNDRLKFVLTWSKKFTEAQSALDHALADTAAEAGGAAAQLLLDKGADPNYDGAISLQRAIEADNRAVFDLLLPRINLEEHGKDILTVLKEEELESPLMADLQKAVEVIDGITEKKDNLALVDAHTLSETQDLPGDMAITTLFNFRSRQQIIIVAKTDPGSAPSVTVNSLDDLDQTCVDALHAKLVELGGTAENTRRLAKTALKQL